MSQTHTLTPGHTTTDTVSQALQDVYGEYGVNVFDRIDHELSLELRIRRLGERVVSTQTDFFRESNISTVAGDAIPLLSQETGGKPVRILEVGCSTGEESYSLAALALSEAGSRFEITAIDVNPEVLEIARLGEYEVSESFEGLLERNVHMPGKLVQAGYFEDAGRTWTRHPGTRPLAVIKPSEQVRHHIQFIKHDITEGPIAEGFDLVVINNVLMHYPDKTRDIIMRNVLGSLRPGGMLTLERKMRPINADEKASFDPYNAWRSDLATKFNISEYDVAHSSDTFYRKPAGKEIINANNY